MWHIYLIVSLQLLTNYDPMKYGAIAGDGGSNVWSARIKINAHFPWILNIYDPCHNINLYLKDLGKLFKDVSSLCNFVSYYLVPLLQHWSNISFTDCYDFSYFALFTYVFSLFLEVSHGAAALTHFSLTHIAATLLTHCTAIVLTHSIAILIALPHLCSIYSGQSCRLFFS